MNAATNGVMPLFGSEARMLIVAELFSPARPELSGSELHRRTGVSQPTVSQELARLERYGIVTVRSVGRARLASANWSLPWAADLAGLLARSIGVPAQIGEALRRVPGADAAHIFGSWAARFHGVDGPAPHDIDLLVVGDADPDAVRAALRSVERAVRLEIDSFVIPAAQWAKPAKADALIRDIKANPTVDVPVVQQ